MTASDQVIEDARRPPAGGKITDTAVEVLRERIGVPVRHVAHGYEQASRDVMRNYARSTGDLNPLYRDRDHAERTRWGGLLGYPTLLQYMGEGNGHPLVDPATLKGMRGDPLAGVHGLHAGLEMHFTRPVYEDDSFTVKGGLGGVEIKPSTMGGRAVHELHDKVYWDREGSLVGVVRLRVVRVEHEAARSHGKHDGLDVPHHYSEDELAEIDRAYEQEYIRGSEPRYWEDVDAGDVSTPLPKGPYTVTSFITQMMGLGLLRNTLFFTHSEAYAQRARHPKGFPRNQYGVPDTVASVHWEVEAARRAGVPERYDAGTERVVALAHAVSNWMGDDAFMTRLQAEVRGFMFVGDTMMVGCTVIDKLDQNDRKGVRLRLVGTNQRGDDIAAGEADVLLPSRESGPVVVPTELDGQVSVFEAQHP